MKIKKVGHNGTSAEIEKMAKSEERKWPHTQPHHLGRLTRSATAYVHLYIKCQVAAVGRCDNSPTFMASRGKTNADLAWTNFCLVSTTIRQRTSHLLNVSPTINENISIRIKHDHKRSTMRSLSQNGYGSSIVILNTIIHVSDQHNSLKTHRQLEQVAISQAFSTSQRKNTPPPASDLPAF